MTTGAVPPGAVSADAERASTAADSSVEDLLAEARDGVLRDLPAPAPLVHRETAMVGKVWDIVRDTSRVAGGEIVREYMRHTGAVLVLAIDDDDRVVLINQYRQPIGEREWEIPAGLLDVEGEDPLLAAQRELAEETDLVADEWSGPHAFHSSPGGSDELIQVFTARGLHDAPGVHERTDEEAEIVVRRVPFDEVVAAVLDGRLRNGPLQVAVLVEDALRRR